MFNLGKKNGYETNLDLICKNYLMVILPNQFYQIFSFIENITRFNSEGVEKSFYLYFDSANDSKSWKGFSDLGSISLDSKAALYEIQIIFPVIKATKIAICRE